MLNAAFGGQTSVAGAGIGGKSVDVKNQQRRAAPGQWEWRDGARQVLERYPWLAHATNAFVDSRFSGRGAVRLGYFPSFESDSGISFRKRPESDLDLMAICHSQLLPRQETYSGTSNTDLLRQSRGSSVPKAVKLPRPAGPPPRRSRPRQLSATVRCRV